MNKPDQENHLVVVPFTELSENTLNKVIQAFVLREGTDYGEREFSLEQKVEQVFEQLKQHKVEITFNINEESFDIKRVSP